MFTHLNFSIFNRKAIALVWVALATSTLTGCYVEISHEHDDWVDTDVDYYSSDITDYSTQLLTDGVLIPLSLAAQTPLMLANPDAYTTPRVRNLTRAAVIETTYAYLLDDWDCDYGGYNQTEAEAATTSYDDGYTYVDFTMNAQARECDVRQNGRYHTVNSNLNFDVEGWYDDYYYEVDTMNASLTGHIDIEYATSFIEHTGLNVSATDITGNDFAFQVSSSLHLDDGYDHSNSQLSTLSTVHWYLNASHPHAGSVKIQEGYDWVELSFDNSGLWRDDSDGYSYYTYWSTLGFY